MPRAISGNGRGGYVPSKQWVEYIMQGACRTDPHSVSTDLVQESRRFPPEGDQTFSKGA
jgi:hypothetical protein